MNLKCFISNTENDTMKNVALLLLRVLAASFLLGHGLTKITNSETLSTVFMDPLGIGSRLSLSLVIFAEVFCSILVIVGFFSRLACLPIIFTMGVAVFVAHAGDPFATKELACVYLIIFIVIFFTGPGKYAVDSMMHKCFHID